MPRRPVYKGRMARARVLVGSVVGLFATLCATSTHADARVVVQLRNAAGATAEGKVILESEDGKRIADCTTRGGTCEMAAVPGGSYKARVEPVTGKAPAPRRVMIPPNGKVSLIVNTEG